MTSTSPAARQPHIVLIPGYWLGAWAWNEVIEKLTSAGVLATALTLPGLDPQDPQRTARTLDDQAEAIAEVLDELGGDAVLVAHSGANGPVSLALDRHPELIRRVIWVDSGPMANGGAYAPDLPMAVSELPLPDFDSLGQEASLDGLTDLQLARFRSKAVPEPAGVARRTVELTNAARHDVATTLICCSLPSAQILALAEQGHPMFSAVAQLTHMDMVDLPTGHWPMWSRPQELADAIRTAANSTN
ncbi:alpha/beta fold hydrolase [Actinomyces slackii]|uniref:Alpha/beta hydrolase family n=1 Tax=Actinomyces slackii TaxID=52774 RepID=A0A448KF18_9ACTO|nr:alpha/beta fold hydrolase [Actinomyces slackii]VEG75557.1 Alpha/beta hydrolase family [Actinomyces slackii]